MNVKKKNGGARPGSGRKSDKRIDEFNALFDAVIPSARMKRMIAKLAKAVEEEGDVRAFIALTNRRYGMPTQKQDIVGAVMVTLPGWAAPRPNAK